MKLSARPLIANRVFHSSLILLIAATLSLGSGSGHCTTQLTSEGTNLYPSAYGKGVAWEKDGIFSYRGGTTIHQRTDNTKEPGSPPLYNGSIAYHSQSPGSCCAWEVFFWNGAISSKISTLVEHRSHPLPPVLHKKTA